ncbi:hypothetical protein [Mucilaginibacter pedocola]|uniref:Macroglobulin domain-containing protein n=1 Tax=Mucilaginibacter pedocola TaxID=1792845 RepID=A0A1S9PDM4_9SPHI|nr:hypothetical protein [Mucilaginibacter pedocola]OOQ59076.1 hypothetical protein BC343_29615 [Mucilaginibacter pedocola]
MKGKIKLNILKKALPACLGLLALITKGFAQEAPAKLAFDKYSKAALQEKIYVHVDKSVYVTGEIVWFKIYCVDGTYNKPLNLSKIVYVEILDNANASVMQAKIAMYNGIGSGSLMVPPALVNGNYKLRAYTNWMKNFEPEGYFEKKITIINTLRTPDVAAKTTGPDYDVQFFPEGGDLVNGLPANVAFKAVGRNGLGIAFKGAIINQSNDTVARFQPLKFGMGHFAFTPVANNSYRAVIRVGNQKPLLVNLPAAKSEGYTMQVTDAGNGNLNVKVNSSVAGGQLLLLAQTRGLAKLSLNAAPAGGIATFIVGKDKLGEGVSSLTVFNDAGQPVCERLYFKRPKQALFVDAVADAPQYASRKKVSVTIAAKNATDKMIGSSLSMAVYRLDSLQAADTDNIAAYLWLGSELKGAIESPGYYLSGADEEATDNLLLTQGWRRFKWNNILNAGNNSFKYLPEFNGHMITARVTDSAKNAAKDVIAYLAIPGKRVQMYAAKSDANGTLLFNTKEFYGAGEVVVQTNTERDTTHRIEVLNPFSEQFAKTRLPTLELLPYTQAALQQQSLGAQVQTIYAANKLKRYFEPKVDSAAFFGAPFKTYKLDDYTRFVTMEEVVREYISEATVSRLRGRPHITLIDENGLLSPDPLIMVDGVPVFKTEKVFAVDPLKVQRLQVVRNRYFWGPSVYEGIMNYTTYKGDLGGTETDAHATVIDYEGAQVQREFYSPVYETEEQAKSRIPDFRNLLFWSPDIKTGSLTANKVAFYTSDVPGKYFGIVQGMAANGDAASKTFTFEVK